MHPNVHVRSSSHHIGTQKHKVRFWNEASNQREYFDSLGQRIGIKNLDEWYIKLSKKLLRENGGSGVLYHHNESPATALMSSYPEHNWIPWKFSSVPREYWKEQSNQRKFFDNLGQQLGITALDDWYQKLSLNVIAQAGGGGLLMHYKKSPVAALMNAYPEHNWIPWKFNFVPDGFWKVKENQQRFVDWLGIQLGVEKLDDWYHLFSASAFHKYGGSALIIMYKGSPQSLFSAIYPEHTWHPWKFSSVPDGYWNSLTNVSQFLAQLAEKLSIQTLDDWYRVDMLQLQQFRAGAIISKYKGLYGILKQIYPHYPWDARRFQSTRGKSQRWLAVTLKKLFPNQDVLEDYMHPKVHLPSTKRPMQLDVFIPSMSLAFEYQGRQHYEEVGVFSALRTYQQRDEEKRRLCAQNNIQLIEVPYWWNRKQDSLQQIINIAKSEKLEFQK